MGRLVVLVLQNFEHCTKCVETSWSYVVGGWALGWCIFGEALTKNWMNKRLRLGGLVERFNTAHMVIRGRGHLGRGGEMTIK